MNALVEFGENLMDMKERSSKTSFLMGNGLHMIRISIAICYSCKIFDVIIRVILHLIS